METVHNPSREWLEEAVMVTGPPQSGTTLLMNLLDGSPDLMVYPDEPCFPITVSARSGYRDPRHLGRDFLFGTRNPVSLAGIVQGFEGYPVGFNTGKASPIPAGFVPDPAELKKKAGEVRLRGVEDPSAELVDLEGYLKEMVDLVYEGDYQNERDLIRFAMEKLREKSWYRSEPLKMWGFKKPSLVPYSPHQIITFLNSFPRGKVIVIWRDPRGYYNSHKAPWRNRLNGKPTVMQELRYALTATMDVEECYWALRHELPRIAGDRLRMVKYEDLVSDPAVEMRKLTDFLGIPWREVFTYPTKFGQSAHVVTSRTSESPEKVSSRSIEKWKKDLAGWEVSLVNAIVRRNLPHERETRTDSVLRPLLYMAWAMGFAGVSRRSGTPFCRSPHGRSRRYYTSEEASN